jgi:hypothetical protein
VDPLAIAPEQVLAKGVDVVGECHVASISVARVHQTAVSLV